MPPPDAEEILAATRELLKEARAVIDDGDFAKAGSRTGVLGLYEALCRALDAIDGERVRALLGRIAEQVGRLNELAADVERIRRLRNSIRAA